MGLDITLLGKPMTEYVVEFHALLRELSISNGVMVDDRPRVGFMQRLLGMGPKKLSQSKLREKTARFNAIALPPYASLDAPVVGQHAAADAWALEKAIASGLDADKAREHLAKMAGFHVLALLPPCDGLPVYSHGELGYYVDQTSFRGAFLDLCKDILPEHHRLAVWGVMTAPNLLDYGTALSELAATFAVKHGLTDQLGQRILDWEDETALATQLHIVDSLARWAIFWGKKGHGSYPDF